MHEFVLQDVKWVQVSLDKLYVLSHSIVTQETCKISMLYNVNKSTRVTKLWLSVTIIYIFSYFKTDQICVKISIKIFKEKHLEI